MTINYKHLLILNIFILLFTFQAFAAPKCKSYENAERIKGKNYCVWNDKNRWRPAKKCRASGEYKIKRKPKNSEKLKAWKKLNKSCRNIVPLSKVTLSNLPNLAEMLSAKTSNLSLNAVSGTPPLFSEILAEESTIIAKNLFWREVDGENVIDGINSLTPTVNQCNEFWTGNNENQSGGFGACEGVLGAARSLAKPMEAGVSMCYLQNTPTQDNFDKGGISLVSGKLPGNKITNIFNAPTGSKARIVKIKLINDEFNEESIKLSEEDGDEEDDEDDENDDDEGPNKLQDIYVKVYSKENNDENNNSYKVDLFFCESKSKGKPEGYDKLTISKDNIFSGESVGLREGYIDISFVAGLTKENGALVFDPNADRTADIKFISSDEEESLKMRHLVNVSNGIITLKSYENFNEELRFGYSKTSFTGSNLDDLRVFEGAMKNKVDFEGEDSFTFNAAFEYLDSYYATAIESTLAEAVNSFDFDSDSFFLTEPEIVDNTDQFDCSVKADLVVKMDMSKKSMKKIAQKCESLIPQNTDICRSQELNQAEDNWFNYCSE